MNIRTQFAISATAIAQFDEGGCTINVTSFFGDTDSVGVDSIVIVTDEEWDDAYPKHGSNAQKIESLLGWSGSGETEHDGDYCHITFD